LPRNLYATSGFRRIENGGGPMLPEWDQRNRPGNALKQQYLETLNRGAGRDEAGVAKKSVASVPFNLLSRS